MALVFSLFLCVFSLTAWAPRAGLHMTPSIQDHIFDIPAYNTQHGHFSCASLDLSVRSQMSPVTPALVTSTVPAQGNGPLSRTVMSVSCAVTVDNDNVCLVMMYVVTHISRNQNIKSIRKYSIEIHTFYKVTSHYFKEQQDYFIYYIQWNQIEIFYFPKKSYVLFLHFYFNKKVLNKPTN